MAAVTPEKVKELLTSFIIVPEKSQKSPQNMILKSPGSSAQLVDHNVQDTQSRKSNSSNVLRSYESFLQRFETFSSLTWFGKPAELNPLICARFGWENVEVDMLQCVSCKVFLCGKLPLKAESKVYEESLAKLKKNLLAAHDKFCVLAVNPCSESFCKVPLDDPANLTAAFFERASTLCKIQDQLPSIDYSRLQEFAYEEGQGAAYCKKHFTNMGDLSPPAAALAFTGWSCSSKDILVCSMCRRQVGLWNYTQSSNSTQDNDDDVEESEEPSAKKRRIKVCVKQKFCPVEEHRHWCPWVRDLKSSTSSKQTSPSPPQKTSCPSYITAIKTIAPGLIDNNTGLAQAMKTSPMVDGLRCFRRVLKSWSSLKRKSPQQNQKETKSPDQTGKPQTKSSEKISAKSPESNISLKNTWKTPIRTSGKATT